MSLIGNPPVIFLDEPTTGLDPEARLEVWKEIQSLADSGTTVLLTTQYLEEAEKLADRIAILHQGTIIVSGTLAELRKLLPPAKAEYVERQPTLEEIFLAIVGNKEAAAMSTHVFSDTGVMLGRSMRHVTRSMDTIITVTIMPIAFMLLFVYVFGGAIQTGTDNYVNYLMPGILLIAIASGISYTGFRLFNDMQSGIFERFHSMPIARSSVLWGHVLTSLVSNAISVVVIILVGLAHGLPLVGRSAGLARRRRDPGPVHPRADLGRGDRRTGGILDGRSDRLLLPAHLPAVHQLGVRPHRHDARAGAGLRGEPAGHLDRQRDPGAAGAAAGRQRHLDRPRLVRRHPRRRLCVRHEGLPAQNRLKHQRTGRPRPLGRPVTPVTPRIAVLPLPTMVRPNSLIRRTPSTAEHGPYHH